MTFESSFLDEIRGRVPVSSVIGRKVAWDRRKSNAAKGDYWACCPFHSEKSPSFHVDDRKGRYYCFGCKQSGDIFTFLVDKEGVSFPQAVAQLARDAGLTMKASSKDGSDRRSNEEKGNIVSRARIVADVLAASWMRKEIQRLESAIETDPALAIGTAKELIESCCKTILTNRGVPFSNKADLPELTKLLTKTLKLVPDGISDAAKGAQTIKLILRNLVALTQYLAELRGLYGTGHGRDGKHRGLEVRHARLAANAAVTFVDFVVETYKKHSL